MQNSTKSQENVRISKLILKSVSLHFALGSFASDTTLMNVMHCDRLIFDLFAKWMSVLYKIWIQTTTVSVARAIWHHRETVSNV